MVIEGEKQKQLDREIRDMISALTSRLSDLQQKPSGGGSSRYGNEDDDDDGVRIITIAGSNVGATLRSEVEDKGEVKGEEDDPLATLVNSNFQAINNSIMMGGSYSCNDPGVHMDVTDYVNPGTQSTHATHHNKHGKRGKKKEMDERTTELSN